MLYQLKTEPEVIQVSVILPFFNEAPFLKQVLTVMIETLDALPDQPLYELIAVDDGSHDDTWIRLREASVHFPALRALRLSRNFGKEAALAAGLDACQGQAVITMDGDLQHPPDLIANMLNIWRRGEADIVEAVRVKANRTNPLTRLGAPLFYNAFQRLTGFNLEQASDFKLMDRRVVSAWREMGDVHLFFRGMSAWLGFRRVTLPFETPERVGGDSKWRLRDLAKLGLTGIASFSTLPLHVTTLIGLLFLVLAMPLGLQTLYMKVSGQAFTGFTTVIFLILITGSLVLISLGVIGAYLALIFEQVKGRPRFLVSERRDGRS